MRKFLESLMEYALYVAAILLGSMVLLLLGSLVVLVWKIALEVFKA